MFLIFIKATCCNSDEMTLMMNSISKYTFNYIDAARIIGIFFVVYGHEHPFMETNDLLLRKYVYSFHMPLFFLISGMLSYGGGKSQL